MTPPGPLALVCDAGADTGLGHLSRGLALGEACAEAGAAVHVVGSLGSFARLAAAADLAHHPIAAPLGEPGAVAARVATLADIGATTVVIDSYRITPDDLAALGADRTSVAIDDFAALDRYPTDLVLNFTVGAAQLPYPAHPGLLLGPAWFLARRQLRATRAGVAEATSPAAVARVLVAIGGIDRAGAGPRVVDALTAALPDAHVDVVVGRAGPEHAALEARATGGGVTLTVGAPSLAPHLAAADLVVCGGGLTKYEAAYLGVPVAVLDQSPGEADETETFAALGLALPLGTADDLDDRVLAETLHAFAHDAPARRAMGERGLACFPVDPTAHAARRILG